MGSQNLRTPGPTPLPPSVREALARDMIAHRGAEFARQRMSSLAGDLVGGASPGDRDRSDYSIEPAAQPGRRDADRDRAAV